MSDFNGSGQQQIGNLQIQKNIFEVKQDQLEESLNKNLQDENVHKNANKQLEPVMKHTNIPVFQVAQLNMQSLSPAQITANHTGWIENQALEKKANDFSAAELDHMNFEELAVWATHHAKEKGDDKGEFGPIAKAMTHLLSINKTLKDWNSDDFLYMDMSTYEKAANGVNEAVNKYKRSHSSKPWFKKGKLRAHFCNLVSRDMVEEVKNSQINEGEEDFFNYRKNKFITERVGKDSDNPEAREILKEHVNKLRSITGEDGKPVTADPRAVKLITNQTEYKMLKVHYHLTDEKNARTKKIMDNLKKYHAASEDLDRNVVLKPVKFKSSDGSVLPEYKENDEWNQAYLKALEDGSYETMKPFLEDMFNELLEIEPSDMLDEKKWLNADYLADNIEKIEYFNKLLLKYQGNILKHDEYKKFNDELKNKGIFEAFNKLIDFYSTYMSGVYEIATVKEIGITPGQLSTYESVKGKIEVLNELKEAANMDLNEVYASGALIKLSDYIKKDRFNGFRG